jgi:hypothetical protein
MQLAIQAFLDIDEAPITAAFEAAIEYMTHTAAAANITLSSTEPSTALEPSSAASASSGADNSSRYAALEGYPMWCKHVAAAKYLVGHIHSVRCPIVVLD